MALDTLPADVQTLDRDTIKRRYLRDYNNRAPAADVGPNTLPDHDASIFADSQMILMNNSVVIGRATNLKGQTGVRLDRTGEAEGVERPAATSATGQVIVRASVGGTTILAGDELTEPNTQARYTASTTALYADGDLLFIASVDPGPAGNLEPGTRLVWTSPRAGCAKDCLVAEASDGSGISGGREEATDGEYQDAIIERRKNPPAAGNNAEIVRVVRQILGITVQQVFTYPAILGAGTTAVAVTLRPDVLGGERFTTTAQQGLIQATLNGAIQADDQFFLAAWIKELVDIAVSVTWARGVTGWADTSPWPEFIDNDEVRVRPTVIPTATVFNVGTGGTATSDPQVGQTIGVFELDAIASGSPKRIGKWRRKRIKTVTVVTPGEEWQIEVETANGASDTGYAPTIFSLVSPWSESLDAITVPVLNALGTLGPGEMVPVFYDPGFRQRRTPAPEESWPSSINNLMLLNPLFDSGLVGDASIALPTAASLPYPTPVGVPGVSVKMLSMRDFAVYKK